MELVFYPNELLRTVCSPVEKFDEELARFVSELTVVMYAERGVGIAAPQVGALLNIILVDSTGGEKSDELKVMVNPRLIWASKELARLSEGCLSIPGVIVTVERPEWIEVEYQTLLGEKKVERLGGWPSRITQHEMDHLSGKVMLDRISATSKKLMLRFYPDRKKK